LIFSNLPPSKQWSALKFRGEKFAEVWFKPEGEPCGLTFRIPQASFQLPGMADQLTLENLLRAVAIEPEQIESWRHGDVTHSHTDGSKPESRNPLSPPPPDVSQLEIFVRLQPPPEARARLEANEPEIPSVRWHDLETRWKAIIAMEASMDTLRLSMESLMGQLEAVYNKSLTMEEKTHAPRADVAQWTKAKKRVHIALPKMKDFIHRSTWAVASPERKRLEEIYKDHIQPHVTFPEMDKVLKQLEDLQKDRQILAAHGQTIYQECRGISAEVQGTLRTLQSNAATNARRKKG